MLKTASSYLQFLPFKSGRRDNLDSEAVKAAGRYSI